MKNGWKSKVGLSLSLFLTSIPAITQASRLPLWVMSYNPYTTKKIVEYHTYQIRNQKKVVEQYFDLLVKVAGFWKNYCGAAEDVGLRNIISVEQAVTLKKKVEKLLRQDDIAQAQAAMWQNFDYLVTFLNNVRNLVGPQPPREVWESDGTIYGAVIEYAQLFVYIVNGYFEYFPEVREMVTYGDSEGKDYWRKLRVQLKRLDAELKKPEPDLNLVLDHMTKAVKLLTLAPGTGHDESCSD